LSPLKEHIKDWRQSIEYICGETVTDSLELQYIAILKPYFIRAAIARASEAAALVRKSNVYEVVDDEVPF
jgi:hypothetical protein